jgi:hypothetical protein
MPPQMVPDYSDPVPSQAGGPLPWQSQAECPHCQQIDPSSSLTPGRCSGIASQAI